MDKQFNWQKEFTEWAYCGKPSAEAVAAAGGWQQCAVGEKYGLIELSDQLAQNFVDWECGWEERGLGYDFTKAVDAWNLNYAIDIYNKIQDLPKLSRDPVDYLNYEEEEGEE